MGGLHIGVFASLFIILVVLHFLYIRRFGISAKPFEGPEEYEKSKATGHTFYEHLRNLTGYGLILFAIVIALAYFLPPKLLNAPVPEFEVTKPPWPFLAFVPLEGIFGVGALLIGSIAILIGLILIPVIGSLIQEDRTRFTVINRLLTIGIIFWLMLTLIAYLTPIVRHLE
ncbi:MAG: cytochrome b family protein [Candidatus Aquicultor sp.]